MDNGVITEYCQAIKAKTAQGDYVGGLGLADRLVFSFQNSEKGYFYRGVCYYGLQRLEEAIANYKMALKINPLYARAYFNIGTCYQQLQQNDLALINIGKALILFSKQNKEDAKNKCMDALMLIQSGRV